MVMSSSHFLPFRRSFWLAIVIRLLLAATLLVELSLAQAAPSTDSAQRAVGIVKANTGNGITLTSDAGGEVRVIVQDSTRFLRVAPGEKDLKNATTLQKSDVQTGDRVLARGKSAGDVHSIAAGVVIVMKRADVAAKQEQDRQDWQQRGVGGLVTATDTSAGTIIISMTSFTGSKSVTIHTSRSTILRRYAANSIKFDDARIAPLDQVKVGDQLRARGTKNEDGTELTADEVVSGTFRNLAGTVTQVDPAASTLTLKDVLSKQSVIVKVTNEAQFRMLSAEFAQRIAMRLKAAAAGGIPSAPGASGSDNPSAGEARSPGRQDSSGAPGGGMNGGMGPGRRGPPDIQQILSRMPTATLADLHQGDAVMIVSTEGSGAGEVNAITMLAGVEPILTASPGATQALMLSPWSLSSAGAEAAANP